MFYQLLQSNRSMECSVSDCCFYSEFYCKLLVPFKSTQNKPGLISTDVDKAKELFQQTRGSLVTMPLRFLEVEDLWPEVGTVESLAPYQLFT